MNRLFHTAAILLLALLAVCASTHPARAQWRKLPVYTTRFFNEVFFLDAGNGWITSQDSTILRTTDGGQNWLTATLPSAALSYNRDVYFLNQSLGFISGEDGLWKSNNAGAAWTNISPPNFRRNLGACSRFLDANTGVLGYGNCIDSTVYFFRTTNGGTTWDSISYLTNAVDVSVGGMTNINNVFYAAGGGGKFWSSADSGKTWTLSNTSSNGWQEDLISLAGKLFIASANGGSCNSIGGGKVLVSSNAGSSWSVTLFTSVMWGVTMYSANEGWACGDGANAYKTTDGGSTWLLLNCGMNPYDRLDDIWFTDATHGWAVGDGIYKYVGDSYSSRPDTINYGDVLVGTSSNDSSAFIGTIGGAAAISQRTMGGPDAAMFAITGSSGYAAIASCSELGTPIHFSPSSEGRKTAYVDFTLSPATAAPRVQLIGRGVRPHISAVTQLVYDTLDCTQVGMDTVWVRNQGTYPLIISSTQVQNESGGTFTVVSPIPLTMAPGDSARIALRAAGSATSPATIPVTAQLLINSNDNEPGKSPWIVQLTAWRRAVSAGIAPDTLVIMPPALLGDRSNLCVTYTNTGNGPQTIQSAISLGADPTISVTNANPSAVMAPGLTTSICFTASATDTFVHTQRFRVRTIPCDRDTFITVRFQARNPSINGPGSRTLPAVLCDSGQAYDTVLITNTGNWPLVLNQALLNGTGATDFTIVSPAAFPDTIPVGGTGKIVLVFRPGAVQGSRTPTLLILNNDRMPGKNPFSIRLNGLRIQSLLTLDKHIIDVGDVCIDRAYDVPLRLINGGMAPVGITQLAPVIAAPAISVLRSPVGFIIPPNGVDSAVFRVRPARVGRFSASYAVLYDPCGRADSVMITGRGIGMDLSANPPSVNFGSQNLGSAVTRTVTITNTGSAAATITGLIIQPSSVPVTVTDPPLPFRLDSGQTRVITLSFTAVSADTVRARLLAVGTSLCGTDTLTTDILGRGTSGMLSDCGPVEFGSFAVCDNSTRVDSTCLHLVSGANQDIDVLSASLFNGTAFQLLAPSSLPARLIRGNTIYFLIGVRPSFSGESYDTLVVNTSSTVAPVYKFPLHVHRELGNVAVTLAGQGGAVNQIDFSGLNACNPLQETMLRITNSGTADDTLTIAVNNAAFTATPNGSAPPGLILPANSALPVKVSAQMNAPGTTSGTLTIQSRLCPIARIIPVSATYLSVSSTVTDVVFDELLVGASQDKTLMVRNTGQMPRTIGTVGSADPAVFQVIGSYAGTVLKAGDQLPVTIRFMPATRGPVSTKLTVVFSDPCPDTLVAAATGSAILPNDRYLLSVSADTMLGRWGHNVTVPVRFANDSNGPVDTLYLTLTAHPALLHPLSVSTPDGSRLQAAMGSYTTSDGTLHLAITGQPGNTAAMPSRDTLCLVTYEVLRSDQTNTPIKPRIESPPVKAVTDFRDGAFLLEDYCDAYGRLLRTTGTIALLQNTPNPAGKRAVLTLETSFAGQVHLSLLDALGNQAMVVLDDNIPAGRRTLEVDLSGLPSGAYTIRLRTGLQVITRPMMLAR